MEIAASILATVVAFIALWVASDSLGRGERQYRALLDSHVNSLRKELEKLGETNQSTAGEILRLQQQLTEIRSELAKADRTVNTLNAELASVRKTVVSLPATLMEGRRRA